MDTAILLFSRSAIVEAGHKDFAGTGSKKRNRQLAHHLWKNSTDAAVASKLSVHIINEQNQHGLTFGVKLSNAIEDVFNQGFQKLIIIGSDCPQLDSPKITKAADALNDNKIVLGPDKNGGVYLIGLWKEYFSKNQFQNQPWQTSSLHNTLLTYFSAYDVPVLVLPSYRDINNNDDLRTNISCLPVYLEIKTIIQSFIASYFSKLHSYFTFFTQPFLINVEFRGPPAS